MNRDELTPLAAIIATDGSPSFDVKLRLLLEAAPQAAGMFRPGHVSGLALHLILNRKVPTTLEQIAMVLDNIKFDVIQFNNGMHGWQHSEAEYRKAFPNFIETIQKHAPNAKLIWASTTPLRPSTNSPPTTLKSASSERIITRNAIALEFVRAKRIVVNDLYTPALGRGELYTDGVHFNKEGIATQADLVTSQVEKLLSR
jgi:lysophospholipase L1-like esterase